jgi:hypothetical protein
MPTIEEYFSQIKKHANALKANSLLLEQEDTQSNQQKVKKYFILRAADVGEASLRVGKITLPQFIFARVLCEDFIQFFWANISASNASAYSKAVFSEIIRVMQTSIVGGRAQGNR